MWLFDLLNIPTLLIFLAALLVVYLVTSGIPSGIPDGPKPWPILGNLPLLQKRSTKLHFLLDELYKTYGAVYTLWFGPFPAIVISDLQTIKKTLVQQAGVYSDRPTWMYFINRYTLKRGIAMENGEPWKIKRRWTLTALRDFGVGKRSIEEKIQEEADFMCKEIGKNSGKTFNVHHIFMQAVSNIICSVCFGNRFAYDDKEYLECLNILNEMFRLDVFSNPLNFYPILRFLPWDPFGMNRIDNIMKTSYDFMDKHFAKNEETFDPENIRHLIDLCIQKEKEGAHKHMDLLKLVFDLFAAGTETTSTSLKWLIVYWLNFPEIQRKCQQEVDDEIGDSRMAALSDRPNMPYLDATLHELLRLANTAPTALPHDVREGTTLNGYSIPAHTLVIVNIYSVHMNPDHWDKPEEFQPERWIGPDGKLVKKDAFLPFSIGPRICLGESLAWNELFLFSSTLLQRFSFRPVDKKKLPPMKGEVGMTLSPMDYLVIPESR